MGEVYMTNKSVLRPDIVKLLKNDKVIPEDKTVDQVLHEKKQEEQAGEKKNHEILGNRNRPEQR